MRDRQGELVTKRTDELGEALANVDEDIRAGRPPEPRQMLRLALLVVLGLALLGGFVLKITRMATRNHAPSGAAGSR